MLVWPSFADGVAKICCKNYSKAMTRTSNINIDIYNGLCWKNCQKHAFKILCGCVCEWKYRLLLFLALFWLGERTASTLHSRGSHSIYGFKFFFWVRGPGNGKMGIAALDGKFLCIYIMWSGDVHVAQQTVIRSSSSLSTRKQKWLI